MDLVQKRRAEGRSGRASIEEIIALLKPLAGQQGVDLQGRLEQAEAQTEEKGRQLAERLQRAVLPLFIYRRGYPRTLGSCVLVRLDSTCYAFTAAHVLTDAGSTPDWVPPRGKDQQVRRLPPSKEQTSRA